MGAGAKKQNRAAKLGVVLTAVDGGPILRALEEDAIPLCSWDRYRGIYPHGIVITDDHLALVKGLAANRMVSAIITGETGTGKEEVAKLLHRLRCEKEGKVPFVTVNCATITDSLCESILFGHRRGAFTGADSSTNGYIHDADGGILFLDEIHTLPISIQQKLLRVLNDGTYNRLGETVQLQSRFQLVAASTKDLDDEVDAGCFLLDLRSRLSGIDINLRPLRERISDLPALVARRFSDSSISVNNGLFDKLIMHLTSFHWRGNIRQLFKAIDSWILMSSVSGRPLRVENFPVSKGMLSPQEKDMPTKQPLQPSSGKLCTEADPYIDLFNKLFTGRNFYETIESLEALIIDVALKKNRNISDAARLLGLPRSTIDAKRRKYGLDAAVL